MRRIDHQTVELTESEQLIVEIHELLLDQGMSQGDALILIRGVRVPEELRTPTPLLDAILTAEFADYLSE